MDMDKIKKATQDQMINKTPFRVGDTMKVYQKIKEGAKERIQIFEGLVIAKKNGKGVNGTFTIRKISSGVGVEKIFPIQSPLIDKIEVIKSGKVSKAKIYYIRGATGRKGRLKEDKRDVASSDEDDVAEILSKDVEDKELE